MRLTQDTEIIKYIVANSKVTYVNKIILSCELLKKKNNDFFHIHYKWIIDIYLFIYILQTKKQRIDR